MHGPWNIHPDCQESGAGEAAPHVGKWRAATWFASWIPRLTNGESASRPWIIHWWLGKSQKKPLWCLHVKCARLPEHLHAPSGHSGEEARSEVPRRVDGVAAVQTHGHGDGHDDQADAQWLHAFGSADVLPVSDGQDAQDEGAGADHLREEMSIKTWWKDLLACLFVSFFGLLLVAAVFLGCRLFCSRDLCPLLLSLSLLQGFPFPLVSGSITTYVGMSCLRVCLLRKHTHTHRLLNPPLTVGSDYKSDLQCVKWFTLTLIECFIYTSLL